MTNFTDFTFFFIVFWKIMPFFQKITMKMKKSQVIFPFLPVILQKSHFFIFVF